MRIDAVDLDAAPPFAARIWRVGLDLDPPELNRAYQLLAIDERARAARFAFPVHRHRFITGRAALREILGAQLALDPRNVAFRYTAEGKPELEGRADCHFSVSHSNDLCVIAVAFGARVGIDVEMTTGDRAVVEEVARNFHPAEQQALAALDPAARQLAFYRCWVRKEALLKAMGVGLGGGLDRFEVSVGEDARLVQAEPSLADTSDWTLMSLEIEGFTAALAMERRSQV